MELPPSHGESGTKKRKLEDVLELLPTPSPEFNSRDSSESESKNRKLEELLPTPSPEFNSSDSSESVYELIPPSPEFNSRDSSDSSKEEDIIRKEEEKKKKMEEEDVYFTETEFRKEGEFNILQSANRKDRERYEYLQEIEKEMSEEAKGVRKFFGADVIAEWFCHYPSPSANAFLSKFTNLDAETLKSHLQDGINSEDLGIPDWEELAKYVKQLQESDEGFDLDEYKNLANYTEYLPKRLCDKAMHQSEKQLAACINAAMNFYKNAGGGELKEEKVVKANAMWSSQFGKYYITFSARSCLDGKERYYQAKVMYNGVKRVVHESCEIMVRIKKGY